MPIHVLTSKPTEAQVEEMLRSLGDYIKLAVDVRMRRIAGGGAMHADCEEALLNEGSAQVDVWGADWYPDTRQVEFESFINIRPRQGNRSMLVQDPELRRET